MKTLLGLVTAALTAGAALAADPAALLMRSGRMSAAAMLSAPPLDPSHPAWSKAAPTLLLAYPQQMIAPGLENGAPIPVEMRALASRTHLAVKLTWPDQTRDQYRTDATDTFPDAVAVQFTRLEQSLPYIGMGEKDRPVSMWFWHHGRKPEFLVARGFGTLGPGRGRAPQARSVWHEGRWSVVLLGSLPVERNPLPLAIAIWDGRAQARDGRKHLSAWPRLDRPAGRGRRHRRPRARQEPGRGAWLCRLPPAAGRRGCGSWPRPFLCRRRALARLLAAIDRQSFRLYRSARALS